MCANIVPGEILFPYSKDPNFMAILADKAALSIAEGLNLIYEYFLHDALISSVPGAEFNRLEKAQEPVSIDRTPPNVYSPI